MIRLHLLIAVAFALLLGGARPASADTAKRLHDLIAIPGVSGYETHVREAIEMLLPITARVRADNLGNIVMRTGTGTPHTLVVAPLDESGLVVSAITDDGYVRVHRHTTAPGPRLGTQYFVGQPIEVRTATGAMVPGVTATPSAHLRSMRDAVDEARIKTIDNVWIDLGAESSAEVEKLGVRLLDSVTLRERATLLTGGRVSGVAAGGRAAALALAEVVRRSPGRGAPGTVTLAWVTQSEYGNRGLVRLLETHKPDRVIALRGAGNPGEDPRGAIGQLGTGPLAREGGINLPEKWKGLPLQTWTVPVLFAQTPVETVDAKDVDALAERIASAVGLPPLGPPESGSEGANAKAPSTVATRAKADPAFEMLGALIETYGVSANEAPVRTEIVKRLPSWARPQVDDKGNVVLTFGTGGKPLLFVAHMDEVGFDITNIADDGTAAIRVRGGMYLSNFEAHPAVVMTTRGPVHALLAPRPGYTTAKEAQPTANTMYVYFGTRSAAETKALGVAVGDSLTVRKKFAPLAGHRSTGRAMDDRNGSTALLLALQQLDPRTVANQVTFAWTVEEETGLAGALFLASKAKPDTAFAIDTFVSTDTPVDIQRLAGAKLGRGAVLRVLDSRTIVPPHIVDRIVGLARGAKIPLQLGTTSGGTDASAFSDGGAIDVGLSWPGRYSHSPVEIMDRRDLEALVKLIVALAKGY